MNIQRLHEERLLRAAGQFPALVLTGARQSGKTTLLKEIFSAYRYVSLDLPSQAEQAERDPERFFSLNPPPVLVDEVQYAPGLFRHVKRLIDADRERYGQFILTGSQSFLLMKGVSDSLAGRCAWFELGNLSWAEIGAGPTAPKEADPWLHLLARGQFPELWKRPDLDSNDYLRTYLATYLERDVRQILNVTSLRDFERFIRLLAARSGQILNKTEIAKDTGVSVRTIGDWVSVLEASNQIILLEPWFRSISPRRIVKTPKVYFRDSGLLCHLLGLDAQSLEGSSHLGAVWEGFIYSELRKLAAPRKDRGRFWFYRDQAGREIDLIYEKGGKLNFLEAKWTGHPERRDGATMLKIKHELDESDSPERSGASWIVCRAPQAFPLGDGVMAVGPGDLAGTL